MNQQALLLFSDGLGHDNDWGNSNFVAFPFHALRGIKSKGKNSLELYFNDKATLSSPATVTLSIENGKHNEVTNAIFKSVLDDRTAITTVADVGSSTYAHKYIYGVTVKNSTPVLYYEKITNSTQVKIIDINTKTEKLTSMTLANIHSSAATATVFLSNTTDNWYIIKDVVIPTGSTLKLESDELDYDADVFNLYVKLAGSTPVDVIIR
jgi:hypothetical protein